MTSETPMDPRIRRFLEGLLALMEETGVVIEDDEFLVGPTLEWRQGFTVSLGGLEWQSDVGTEGRVVNPDFVRSLLAPQSP